MQRRSFLRGLFAFGVVAAACSKPPGAEAAPLLRQDLEIEAAPPRAETQKAILDEDMGGARFEPVWHRPGHRPRGNAWGQRRWRRRYYVRPRTYYRPRPRVYRRRRVYRW